MTTDTEREDQRRRLDELIGPFPAEIRDDWADYIRTAAGELVWERDGLPPAMRSVTTIAVLAACQLPVELRLHVRRGLENGLSRREISGVLMHCSVYAGVPIAVEALRTAREVFDEIDAEG